MDKIRWEDPPANESGWGSHKWADVLEPLREHPKRWAVLLIVPTSRKAANLVSAFRNGHRRSPPGRWEFVSRTVDGEHRVYARYLGPDENQDGIS